MSFHAKHSSLLLLAGMIPSLLVAQHPTPRIPSIEWDASVSFLLASAPKNRLALPFGRLRASTQRGGLTLSLGVEQRTGIAIRSAQRVTDTSIRLDSNSKNSRVRTADIVAGVGRTIGRSSFHMLGGMQLNDLRGGQWAGLDAGLYLGAGSALTLSLRQQARNAKIRTPPLTLGLRTTLWRHTKREHADSAKHNNSDRPSALPRLDFDGDGVRFSVYLPNAQQVAVTGDATDWLAADMTRSTGGWWTIALRLPDAVSRIRLRTDNGAWQTVPGLPTTRDEYGDSVSLLVIPAS